MLWSHPCVTQKEANRSSSSFVQWFSSDFPPPILQTWFRCASEPAHKDLDNFSVKSYLSINQKSSALHACVYQLEWFVWPSQYLSCTIKSLIYNQIHTHLFWIQPFSTFLAWWGWLHFLLDKVPQARSWLRKLEGQGWCHGIAGP